MRVRGKTFGLPQNPDPTAEDVDKYHVLYCQEVRRLFESCLQGETSALQAQATFHLTHKIYVYCIRICNIYGYTYKQNLIACINSVTKGLFY